MSIADKKYKELILDIYNNGTWDGSHTNPSNVRAKYADGSPAYCKSVFGRQVVFEPDELPLITCKKMFPVTAVKEMYLFWVKQTVKKEDFDKINCKVWDEWFNEKNNLGKSYAYQFESGLSKKVVEVVPRVLEKQEPDFSPIKVKELQESLPSNSKYVGKILSKNNTHGPYKILSLINNIFTIQFINTGYIRKIDSATVRHKKNVIDPYAKVYFNLGYLGEEDFTLDKKLRDNFYRRWYYMLDRCYNTSSTNFKNYGEKGVFIDSSWFCFTQYVKDILKLPQFFLAQRDNFEFWDIDKDYYSSNCYSKDTCVWLPSSINITYRNNPIAVELEKPNGEKEVFLSITDAAKEYSLHNLDKVVNGQYSQTLGFKCKPYMSTYPLRYSLSRNQVVDLINNIKTNPGSKRLMTSFWNFEDVLDKVLQECAMQTQWNVRGDFLDLILFSRSVDTALGLAFNWYQYKALQVLISHCTGYKPGRFIHQMGNVHYYVKDEQDLLKVIDAPVYEQPKLILKDKGDDFFNYSWEDFSVENYSHSPFVPFEIAI